MKERKNQLPAECGIFERIDALYFDLTKTEKRLASYLAKHRSEPQYMSISELAQASEVAEATISRFCRKLGLKGFNSFKLELAKAAFARQLNSAEAEGVETGGADDVASLAQTLGQAHVEAIWQTREFIVEADYQKAVELLQAARHVYCMGLGGSHVLAYEAFSLFTTVDPKFSVLNDPHMQSYMTANFDEQDLILYFSYSGATKDLLELFALAQKRQVKIILISRYPNSPGAKYADLTLQCGSNESALKSGSVSARIAQLMVIDILFELYIKADSKTLAARERAMDALSDKML
ncbi:MAG: MurR/RpiR family transcriptional regulator [Eubacteriales bacterium]|nr:MurR/RpiR family transcriptional regulator [Eubacteriales bacterium]